MQETKPTYRACTSQALSWLLSFTLACLRAISRYLREWRKENRRLNLVFLAIGLFRTSQTPADLRWSTTRASDG